MRVELQDVTVPDVFVAAATGLRHKAAVQVNDGPVDRLAGFRAGPRSVDRERMDEWQESLVNSIWAGVPLAATLAGSR